MTKKAGVVAYGGRDPFWERTGAYSLAGKRTAGYVPGEKPGAVATRPAPEATVKQTNEVTTNKVIKGKRKKK